MQNNFNADLKRVLVLEGGYVNNPKDPGGATNFGVTQAVYDGYRKGANLAVQSVKKITSAEVAEIYRLQYANKVHYDDLPAGVDGVVFDGAVNSGPHQSALWLQRALGNVKVDGMIGLATVNAAVNYPDHDELIAKVCERRLAFMKALKTWSTFGKGWANRVGHVKVAGQAIATGSVGPAPVYYAKGEAKALLGDARAVPTMGFADATSGSGVAVIALNKLTDGLTQLAWVPHMDRVLSVATAGGAVLMAGGMAYRAWAMKKTAELHDALGIAPPAPEAAA